MFLETFSDRGPASAIRRDNMNTACGVKFVRQRRPSTPWRFLRSVCGVLSLRQPRPLRPGWSFNCIGFRVCFFLDLFTLLSFSLLLYSLHPGVSRCDASRSPSSRSVHGYSSLRTSQKVRSGRRHQRLPKQQPAGPEVCRAGRGGVGGRVQVGRL